jgi:hypothetical protein
MYKKKRKKTNFFFYSLPRINININKNINNINKNINNINNINKKNINQKKKV